MAGEHGVLSAAQRDQIRILHENGVRLQELLEGRTGEARTPEPEDIEALTMSADIDIDQSSGRILIADDHAGMRQYLGRLLGRRWKVEVVPDGRAALAAARARRPDLVIADVEMPVLGGFGLVQQLRGDSRTSTIPVLLVSGQAGEDSRIKRSPTGDTPGSASGSGSRAGLSRSLAARCRCRVCQARDPPSLSTCRRPPRIKPRNS